MIIAKYTYRLLLCIGYCWAGITECTGQLVNVRNDLQSKIVVFGNKTMTLMLDYNKKANISELTLNGQKVIQSNTGIYSNLITKKATYSTLHLLSDPVILISDNTVRLSSIGYGDERTILEETWTFTINDSDIQFDIERTVSAAITVEQMGFPVIMFNRIDTWEGAYQDYGGLAWFYLFNKPLDSYGVHSSSSDFWNSKTGTGLTIAVTSPGEQIAMEYSRTADDKLAYRISVASQEMQPRFDAGTHRRRFLRDSTTVWGPFTLRAGKSSQRISFSSFNFKEKYGRGNLIGLPEEQVSAVANTIARIGVIDRQHFGGNSWHTPYGPICLHEQYIAQMGLAINDDKYLNGYQACLDFYRDNAIAPDGRVWPRWAYTNEDAMPKGYTDKGFYEAQWGYLLDSNPDFVTNVAELYDQTGNLDWVRTHQEACEKALDWILKRDSNGNGLVEMITESHTQKQGSDWIDIIWASYENAFVNAKLYRALVLWADIEKQLGNVTRATQYKHAAEKLKVSFNKSTSFGGFWDDKKNCYVHWRDKDGSIHGNNMVTPVNFMAIAYGICEDASRCKAILDEIETQMVKENLFFWPICLYSYAAGEGNNWQFPFPNYENGDIFLSWGAVAVKAYADYKPELAIKYVNKVLSQYAKDGLAFQRYGREKQDGRGDDILSGNSLAVVGLYQAIYGINPLYNRFYLNPHITKPLAGTQLNYTYRNQRLTINLDVNRYSVSNGQFKIISERDFGFFATDKKLLYFNGNTNKSSLHVTTPLRIKLTLLIRKWEQNEMLLTAFSDEAGSTPETFRISDLRPDHYYTLQINSKTLQRTKSTVEGTLSFSLKIDSNPTEIVVLNK